MLNTLEVGDLNTFKQYARFDKAIKAVGGVIDENQKQVLFKVFQEIYSQCNNLGLTMVPDDLIDIIPQNGGYHVSGQSFMRHI